ncbi:MAG: PLP-dependent aminotransferase family protein [Oscillospiraceae bacterium]|nr:PLP-dependent aminotransferase family protein [Oscillospiraceae bacterium]
MLTYTLEKGGEVSLYEQLYRYIKGDILSGTLSAGEKLPSKRTLAEHLQVSVITVKNAYEQLVAEGYIIGVEKRGYFVCDIDHPLTPPDVVPMVEQMEERAWFMDFVTSATATEFFPFTTWAKLMRRTILERDTGLLRSAPSTGAPELRCAIADYLHQFRGMTVSPQQIIIGAGTETLYSLLVQLLGREKCYAVEDPGYGKIGRIYGGNQVAVRYVPLDEAGLSVEKLRKTEADVVHLSPSHHYPTGTVMPIARRRELLRWAAEGEGRYILEDDYDSEFRFVGRPIPTLYSADEHGRVIYLNTFSKTIAPSIRINYMILPPHLLSVYREKVGFYACTVSAFEQYTLASFLSEGHFEQHLSRMRKRYHQKRDAVIDCIRRSDLAAKITEQDAGLHFLVHLVTALDDQELRRRAAEEGLRLALLSDYYADPTAAPHHVLVVNYAGLELEKLPEALERLGKIMKE